MISDSYFPIEIYISYTHEDEKYKEEIEKRLDIWVKNHLITFRKKKVERKDYDIQECLDKSKIILILISADYLVSDDYVDVEKIMSKHEIGAARVIPIILRAVNWFDTPLKKLLALPTNGKPISSWENRNEAFSDITDGIQRAIWNLIKTDDYGSKNITKPVEVYFSYVHQDEELRDELERHLILLKRQGLVSFWHYRKIIAGTTWAPQIFMRLNSAQIVLILVSKNYLRSGWCLEIELKRVIDLYVNMEARVIPILINDTDLTGSPLVEYQALLANAVSINSSEIKNQLFKNISEIVQSAVGNYCKNPVKIYISYSHKDKEYLDHFENQLNFLFDKGILRVWHDRRIVPGSEWFDEIDKHLRSADIILLLISHNYLASDFCYDFDMRVAMERHNAGEARVIPILLSPVNFAGAPFDKLQYLPRNAKPISEWADKDEAFHGIIIDLLEVINHEEAISYKVSHAIVSSKISSNQIEDIHLIRKSHRNQANESQKIDQLTKSYDQTEEIQMSQQSHRNQVFVSYSHKDRIWLERLQTMLSPLIRKEDILYWDDTKIKPGSKWMAEIQKSLESSKVAVLLVSANFLASNFINEHELPQLLKAADSDGLTVLWVYVSECLYDETEIKGYQAAHDISRPLDRLSRSRRSEVLKLIANAINTAMKS